MTEGEKMIWAAVYARFMSEANPDGTRIDGSKIARRVPIDLATSAVIECRRRLQLCLRGELDDAQDKQP